MSDDASRAEFEARVLRALEDLRLDTFSNRVLLTDMRKVRPTFTRIAGAVAAGMWLFIASAVGLFALLIGSCHYAAMDELARRVEARQPAPPAVSPSSDTKSTAEPYPWPQPRVP